MPIIVTESGIVMAAREEHLLKALLPIVVTESGRVMAIREKHPLKAPLPIVVTPSGRMMAVREEHPWKARLPIVVTPFAKVTSVSSRSFKKLSPEYTADLGILGRIWAVFGKDERKILTALELGCVVNV
jgi:hypothetical protein